MGYISKDMNSVIEQVTNEAKEDLRIDLEKRMNEEFKKMQPAIIATLLSRLTFATNLILNEGSSIPEFRVTINYKK